MATVGFGINKMSEQEEINKLGTIKWGRELGYKAKSQKYVWHACEDCGKERWVQLRRGQLVSRRCESCKRMPRGAKASNWKGGRVKAKGGYIYIRLQPDDFFYPMTNKDGYVFEHRLVVARALGRCLHSWEIVHHKENCPKDDNRYPETLQLVTDDRHKQITILENRIKLLEKGIQLWRTNIPALWNAHEEVILYLDEHVTAIKNLAEALKLVATEINQKTPQYEFKQIYKELEEQQGKLEYTFLGLQKLKQRSKPKKEEPTGVVPL